MSEEKKKKVETVKLNIPVEIAKLKVALKELFDVVGRQEKEINELKRSQKVILEGIKKLPEQIKSRGGGKIETLAQLAQALGIGGGDSFMVKLAQRSLLDSVLFTRILIRSQLSKLGKSLEEEEKRLMAELEE